MKKFNVCAAPGRSVPVPPSVLRAPTGAQVVLLATSPAGRPAHPHERVGAVELELTDDAAIAYVRGRIKAGDLLEQKAGRAAAAPKEPTP